MAGRAPRPAPSRPSCRWRGGSLRERSPPGVDEIHEMLLELLHDVHVERGRPLLGEPELASAPPIHRGFSNTTVTISATSLPPSCLVVTLTNQPGLRSDNPSCCSTNPVFPGSVGRANLTIFVSGLRTMVTSRVLPCTVVWSVRVLTEASIALTVPEIGASSATEGAALTTTSATITDIALVTSSSSVRHLAAHRDPASAV